MFRSFLAVILGLVFLNSSIALASALPTAEKWYCKRAGIERSLRHVAVESGKAPCKVFYSRHLASDPTDAQEEAKQDAGEVHPIFYSNHTPDFCTKKMLEFLEDRSEHDWTCTRV